MFGTVVLDLPDEPFEAVLARSRKARGVANDADLDAADAARRSPRSSSDREGAREAPVPGRPARAAPARHRGRLQVAGTASAPSTTATPPASPTTWAPRSTSRRWCSATWARGSGTGVLTTRNVTTGEPSARGRLAHQRPGRGRGGRHPRDQAHRGAARREMPRIHAELARNCRTLEKHFREVQDVEFTDRARQAVDAADARRQAHRAGRRAHRRRPRAARSSSRATRRWSASPPTTWTPSCTRSSTPREKAAAKKRGDLLATGLNVSPGAASGILAFDADTAEQWGAKDEQGRDHGPARDQARRRARHARGARHPHQPRRAHQPRGARGAAVRQARGRGRLGHGGRPRRSASSASAAASSARATRSPSTARRARCSPGA